SLMKVNIFKRLESSIHSFNKTLERLVDRLEKTINLLTSNKHNNIGSMVGEDIEDMDDDVLESITVGSDKIKIDLLDIDHVKWLDDLEHDLSILTELLSRSSQINANRDAKLDTLKGLIHKKIDHPINPNNKKVIIFSAFADTARYLYEQLAHNLKGFGLHSALVVGSGENKTTMKGVRIKEIGRASCREREKRWAGEKGVEQ